MASSSNIKRSAPRRSVSAHECLSAVRDAHWSRGAVTSQRGRARQAEGGGGRRRRDSHRRLRRSDSAFLCATRFESTRATRRHCFCESCFATGVLCAVLCAVLYRFASLRQVAAKRNDATAPRTPPLPPATFSNPRQSVTLFVPPNPESFINLCLVWHPYSLHCVCNPLTSIHHCQA